MLSVMLSPTIGSALIVGGGSVAHKKLKALLDANFKVTIITKEINFEIPNHVELKIKSFEDSDIDNYFLIFASTNDLELNNKICILAKEKNKLVQNVSRFEEGTFINPAVYKNGDLTISVSTNGNDPKLSVKIRDKIKDLILDENVDYSMNRRQHN